MDPGYCPRRAVRVPIKEVITELLKSLKRHQFFTLSSGVVTAQLLSLAFMPVLTRMYPVESFGYFAIYLAFSNLTGIFATLRLEMTIPLAENEAEADHLSSITSGLVLAVGILLAAAFATPGARALLPSMDQSYSTWVLIALSAALIGWVQVITQRILRNGRLKFISIRHIVDKGSFIVISLTVAKLGFTATGLIIAQTAGTLLSVVVLLLGSAWWPRIHVGRIRLLLRKYSDFPKYNTLSMAMGLASNQLPTLFYSNLFSVQSLGFHNLAQRVADAPNTAVTSALGMVFYRRVLNAQPQQYKRIFLRALMWSGLAFLVPAILVSLIAQPLFSFAFGEKWVPAVPYFLALLPLTVARMSFTLQQGLLIAMRRLDIDFRISALVLGAQVLGIALGTTLTDTLLGPVMVASLLSTVVYGYALILIYRLVLKANLP